MKRNVLLVEGDPRVLKLTQFMLEQAGFVVKCVSDGYAAMDALRTFDFDLALLDIHLPRMSGIRLLREVQIIKDRATPPILLLANESEQAEIKRAMQAGAWDFIMKPLNGICSSAESRPFSAPAPNLRNWSFRIRLLNLVGNCECLLK